MAVPGLHLLQPSAAFRHNQIDPMDGYPTQGTRNVRARAFFVMRLGKRTRLILKETDLNRKVVPRGV
jgi:hypothetical protein